MNGQQTMTALFDIANAYAKQYEAQAAVLDKVAKIEKKALMIERNMASNCAAFARMEYDGNIFTVREKMVFRQNRYFDAYREEFAALTGDARESFLVFAHAVTMVRGCFYDRHKITLNAAEAAGNAEDVFENRLICGVCGQILDDWCAWWKENGCVDCGEISCN